MNTKHETYVIRKITLLAIVCGMAAAGQAVAADKPIHPEANRLLRESSDRLVAAREFSFKAEVWEDTVLANHKITTTKTVDVRFRRPNGVQIEVRSPSRSRGFWYDGRSLTLLDRMNNLYGTVPTPDTMDKVLDDLNDKYGINFPLEDLLVSDPYGSAMAGIKGGAYFGKVTVLGTPCHHVGFSTDKTDLQLWISDDDKLPRKLVITYKQETAQPQVTAIFNSWDLKAKFPDDTFTFTAPKGASKIEVLPAAQAD